MPHQLSWVGLLAMFGDTFHDKGEGPPPSYSPIYSAGDGHPRKKGGWDGSRTGGRFKAEDFNEPEHEALRRLLENPDVDGVVVFECQDMCSSCLGTRKGIIYGGSCTFKTLDMALWHDYDGEKKHLRFVDMELASTQKLAVGYYIRAEPAGADDQVEECRQLKAGYWTEGDRLEDGSRVFTKEGEEPVVVSKSGKRETG